MTRTAQPTVTSPLQAADIAAALGPGWRVAETENRSYTTESRVRLDGPDATCPVLRFGGYRNLNRISITGVYDADTNHRLPYGTPHITITVSQHRNPASIAAEIQRRLLPRYLDQLAAVRAAFAADDQRAQARTTLAARLGINTTSSPDDNNITAYPHYLVGVHAQVRIDYSGTRVGLTLDNLPPDIAVAIVALLTTRTTP